MNRYDSEFNRSFPVQVEGPEYAPPGDKKVRKHSRAGFGKRALATLLCCAVVAVGIGVVINIFGDYYQMTDIGTTSATLVYDLSATFEEETDDPLNELRFRLMRKAEVVRSGYLPPDKAQGSLVLTGLNPNTIYRLCLTYVSSGGNESEKSIVFCTLPLPLAPSDTAGGSATEPSTEPATEPVTEPVTEPEPVPELVRFELVHPEGDWFVNGYIEYAESELFTPVSITMTVGEETFPVTETASLSAEFVYTATVGGELTFNATYNYLYQGEPREVTGTAKVNVVAPRVPIIRSFTLTRLPLTVDATATAVIIPNEAVLTSTYLLLDGEVGEIGGGSMVDGVGGAGEGGARFPFDAKAGGGLVRNLTVGSHTVTLVCEYVLDGAAAYVSAEESIEIIKNGTDLTLGTPQVTQIADTLDADFICGFIQNDSIIMSLNLTYDGQKVDAALSADGLSITATLPATTAGKHTVSLTVAYTTDGVPGTAIVTAEADLEKIGTDLTVGRAYAAQSATSRQGSYSASLVPNNSTVTSVSATLDGKAITVTLSANGQVVTSDLPLMAPGAHTIDLRVEYTTDGLPGVATATTKLTVNLIGTPPSLDNFYIYHGDGLYMSADYLPGDATFISATLDSFVGIAAERRLDVLLVSEGVPMLADTYFDSSYELDGTEIPVGTELFRVYTFVYHVKYMLDGYEQTADITYRAPILSPAIYTSYELYGSNSGPEADVYIYEDGELVDKLYDITIRKGARDGEIMAQVDEYAMGMNGSDPIHISGFEEGDLMYIKYTYMCNGEPVTGLTYQYLIAG